MGRAMMTEQQVNELHHNLIEQAKDAWDAGRSGRKFCDHLRQCAAVAPAVKLGRVAVQITEGPGTAWTLKLLAIEGAE